MSLIELTQLLLLVGIEVQFCEEDLDTALTLVLLILVISGLRHVHCQHGSNCK